MVKSGRARGTAIAAEAEVANQVTKLGVIDRRMWKWAISMISRIGCDQHTVAGVSVGFAGVTDG